MLIFCVGLGLRGFWNVCLGFLLGRRGERGCEEREREERERERERRERGEREAYNKEMILFSKVSLIRRRSLFVVSFANLEGLWSVCLGFLLLLGKKKRGERERERKRDEEERKGGGGGLSGVFLSIGFLSIGFFSSLLLSSFFNSKRKEKEEIHIL